jgi:hypothetical protein
MSRKHKGHVQSDGPEASNVVEPAPSAFVRVTNTRQGPIHVGVLTFPPGGSVHEAAVFAAFSPSVSEAVGDMVKEGWLKFEGHDPGAPVPAPELPPAPEPELDPRPTLEAIAASTSAAELDAWFQMPNMSAELSEAILVRQSALSPA